MYYYGYSGGYGYNNPCCCYNQVPYRQQCCGRNYGCCGGYGSNAAIILVLFILLVIVIGARIAG